VPDPAPANAQHSLELDLVKARRIAEDGLILRTTVGSVVHGLSNPGTDDRDEMGVCIEPPEYLLGFQRFEHSSTARSRRARRAAQATWISSSTACADIAGLR
jgi:hypothetical protein